MAVEEHYETICAKIQAPDFLAAAADAQLVWGKVGSYPFWPAQKLPEDAIPAIVALAAAKRPKTAVAAVMFFGEYTFSWLPAKAVLPWADGVKRGFHNKSQPLLRDGVREAASFLAFDVPRKAPPSWWTEPPVRPVAQPPPPPPAQVLVPVKQEPHIPEGTTAVAGSSPTGGSHHRDRAARERWSSRDVLKPLVNRLRQIFPSLSSETTPRTTQELIDWIQARFGGAMDVDPHTLKGRSQFDLLAQLFEAVTKTPFTGEQISACFLVPGAPHQYVYNRDALHALGIHPEEWELPLKGVVAPPLRPIVRSTVPVHRRSSNQAPAAAATSAVPAVAQPATWNQQSDPLAPTLQVVQGKVIIPKRWLNLQASGVGASSSAGDAKVEPSLDDSSGGRSTLPAALTASALNTLPIYTHVKQNVWVSRPKPKRLVPEEVETCNCELPALPADWGLETETPLVEDLSTMHIAFEIPAVDTYPAPLLNEPSHGLEAGRNDEDAEAIVHDVINNLLAALDNDKSPPAGTLLPAPAAVSTAPQQVFGTALNPASRRPSSRQQKPAPCGSGRHPSAVQECLSTRRGGSRRRTVALPRDGCDEHCLNRHSYVHCDSRTCPLGDRCSNRPFHQLPNPEMEVFLTHNKGWGVRAKAFIGKGSFVAEYAGEIIDEITMRVRMELARQQGEPHFYMMELCPGLVIDARSKGTVARLLNSSCDPNCVTQKWRDGATGEVRVGIFALRDIAPGEELCYNYNFQQLFGQGGEYSCKCGAPSCTGNMDARQQVPNFGRRLEVWWPGDELYYAGKITGYSATTGEYSVVYDDGEAEKVDLDKEDFRWLDEGPTAAAAAAPPPPSPPKELLHALNAVLPPQALDKAPKLQHQPLVLAPRRRGRPRALSRFAAANVPPPAAAATKPLPDSSVLPENLRALVATLLPKVPDAAHLPIATLQNMLSRILPAISQHVRSQAKQAAFDAGSELPVFTSSKNLDDLVDNVPTHGSASDACQATDSDADAVDVAPMAIDSVATDAGGEEVGVDSARVDSSALVDADAAGGVQIAAVAPVVAAIEDEGTGAVFDVLQRMLDAVVAKDAATTRRADLDAPTAAGALAPEMPLSVITNTETIKDPALETEDVASWIASLREATARMTASQAAAHFASMAEQVASLRRLLENGSNVNNASVLVDNPGAQAVAGRLHGNGAGTGAASERSRRSNKTGSVSARGRKRQRKSYGDDYLEDSSAFAQPEHMLAAATQASYPHVQGEEDKDVATEVEPESPARVASANNVVDLAAAIASPGVEAAATIAALSSPKGGHGNGGGVASNAAALGGGAGGGASQRRVASASALRRAAPTPPSTGLPARTILVAKRLTNSDVTKGRILLPRAAVEANLSFAVGRAHSLAARDHLGQAWEFTLQSWANGVETRRVYVLEHAGDFIRRHMLKLDDVIGISSTEEGAFLVEYNTEEVCTAAETQMAARGIGGAVPYVPPAGSFLPSATNPALPAAANPLIQHNEGRCTRSEHCTKPAGHPGFCLRKPAGSASGVATSKRAASARRPPSQPSVGRPSSAAAGSDGAAAVSSYPAGPVMKRRVPLSFDDVGRPKRTRRPSGKLSSYRLDTTEEDEPSYSDMAEEGLDDDDDDDDDEDYDLEEGEYAAGGDEDMDMDMHYHHGGRRRAKELMGVIGHDDEDARHSNGDGDEHAHGHGHHQHHVDDVDDGSHDAEERNNSHHNALPSAAVANGDGGGPGGGEFRNAHPPALPGSSLGGAHLSHRGVGGERTGRASTPPPPEETGFSVPPIFVMATDASVPPPMPPHLRSPLRPSMAARQQPLPSAPSLSNAHSLGSQGSLPAMPPLGGPQQAMSGFAGVPGLPGVAPPATLPPALPLSVSAQPNSHLDVSSFLVGNTPPAANAEQLKQQAQAMLADGAFTLHQHDQQQQKQQRPGQMQSLPDDPPVAVKPSSGGGAKGLAASQRAGLAATGNGPLHLIAPPNVPLFGGPPPAHAPSAGPGHRMDFNGDAQALT